MIALLLILAQDVTIDVRACAVSGRAALPNQTMLSIHAVRIERRWTGETFAATPSDTARRRATAAVQDGAFAATLKSGPPGVYRVIVSQGERELAQTLSSQADVPATAAQMRHLSKVADDAGSLLTDLEAIVAGTSDTKRGAYVGRAGRLENDLVALGAETDLTATVALLKDICYQLRNAQAWSSAQESAAGRNDPVGVLLEPSLTPEGLRRRLESVPKVMSREFRLSSASMLAVMDDRAMRRTARGLMERAEDDEFRAALEAAADVAPETREEVVRRLQRIITESMS